MSEQELMIEILREMQTDIRILTSDIKEIRESQVRQEEDIKENKEDLKVHMSRTEANEARIENLEDVFVGFKFLGKFLAGCVALGGALVGIIKYWR